MILQGLKYYSESGKLTSPVPVPNHIVIHGLSFYSLLAALFEVASILEKILYFLLVSEKGSQTSGRDTWFWKPLHVYLY